ncbi:MAG TPA: serine hydrolase domain-containing protein [Symbiobacteriaceae bacterium]|nr:serine hydrolase domain-containing protein [Symbiobacteriaceae bacterium]
MQQLLGFAERVQGYMSEQQVPGLAVAVVRDGALLYSQGFGVTSVEDGGLPVTTSTLFRIGSITKALTGTMLMRLVEQGTLELDRPIVEYIPWFRLSRPEWSGLVTLRMLLTHRSGIPTELNQFGRRDPEGLEAHVREEIPRLQVVAPPGTVYCYSNGGLNVAGYLAQVVTGKPFTVLMDELLLRPLGMGRTTFDPMVAITYPVAQAHRPGPDGSVRVVHRMPENTADYPCGFAFSTADDLARFASMHLCGGQGLLSPDSVDAMHRPQFPCYNTFNSYVGLAFRTYGYKGRRRVFHGGAIDGFRASLELLPDEGLSVIILGNGYPTDGFATLGNAIIDELLGLEPGPWVLPAVAPEGPVYTGWYISQRRGLIHVFHEGDQLVAERHGERLVLEAIAPHLYRQRNQAVAFVSPEIISYDGTPATRYEPDPSFTPDPARWSEYVGTYLRNSPVTIRLEEGRLLVDSAGFGEVTEAVPVGPDEFACKWGCFRFTRNEAGQVNGKLWWGERFYAPTASRT